MDYSKILEKWDESGLKKPEVLILYCLNKPFAVVEDDSRIIIVASKTDIIYAIAKNKISLNEEDKIPYYSVEDSRSLKVISCTRPTKANELQYFIVNNIVQFI